MQIYCNKGQEGDSSLPQTKEVDKLRKITLVAIAVICLVVFASAYGLASVPLPSTNSEKPSCTFEQQDNPRPYSIIPVKPVDNPRPY
jgi:hypothetical protein